jgi:heat shock protein HtpX
VARDLELQVRIGASLTLLIATAGAAVFGFFSLFRLRPGWWPLWSAIASLLVVALAARYGAGRAALLKTAGAKLSTDARLVERVNRISSLAAIPPPALAISSASVPNAFAVGWGRNRAVVVLTRPLCELLTQEELEAVVAHEVSHIANRDALVMTMATIPAASARSSLDREPWRVSLVLPLAGRRVAVGLVCGHHDGALSVP